MKDDENFIHKYHAQYLSSNIHEDVSSVSKILYISYSIYKW